MTTQVTRELSVNITVTNTWTQLNDLSTGAAYTVPANTRADVKWLKGLNFGANLATIEFAISVNAVFSKHKLLLRKQRFRNFKSTG